MDSRSTPLRIPSRRYLGQPRCAPFSGTMVRCRTLGRWVALTLGHSLSTIAGKWLGSHIPIPAPFQAVTLPARTACSCGKKVTCRTSGPSEEAAAGRRAFAIRADRGLVEHGGRHDAASVSLDGTTLLDLGTLGGSSAHASWINDDGEVTGVSYTENDETFLASAWKNGLRVVLCPMIERSPAMVTESSSRYESV